MSAIDLAPSPNPCVSAPRARDLLRVHWALAGELTEIGSTQDQNFRVDADDGRRYVLRIANRHWSAAAIDVQAAAMRHCAEAGLGVEVPALVPTARGGETVNVDGQLVRLLTWVDGTPLSDAPHLATATLSDLGRLAARTQAALADFEHPGLDRPLQWEPRAAAGLVDELLPRLEDLARRALVRAALAPLQTLLAGPAAELPVQAIHCDVTDYNVVAVRDAGGRLRLWGLIDFGDVTASWRVAEPAHAAAAAIAHELDDPLGAALAVIEGFLSEARLDEHEADAFWSLVLTRAVVQALSSTHQLTLAAANPQVERLVAEDWATTEAVLSVPAALATAAVRGACGFEPSPAGARARAALAARSPMALISGALDTVDLSMTTDRLEFGAWRRPQAVPDAAAIAGVTPVGRYGEVRLTQAGDPRTSAPETLSLGCELFVAAGTAVHAPIDATAVMATPRELRLELALGGEPVLLRLSGVTAEHEAGVALSAGDRVGTVAPADRGPSSMHVQMCVGGELPAFARARDRDAALAVCLDPSALLGLDAAAPDFRSAEEQVARRAATVAAAQKLYYRRPPEIVRGWRHLLYDSEGRPYVDAINNVAVLGHSHPAIVAAAERQLRLLNTNSRFLYRAQAEFAERVTALLPAPLDTVLFVNSGSEATDLALQIAQAATGRRDVIAIEGAYHGWTGGPLEVWTFPGDRPDWRSRLSPHVRVVDQPDPYRGVHGPDADPYLTSLRHAVTAAPPAAFISEPLLGNQGGIIPPAGYLERAYALVRAAGGVCIADEVQTGYGRTGPQMWAFAHERVVPDIVCVAKAAGNGFPVGAVICRRQLSDAFGRSLPFFSSAAGSPLSCAVGAAVIDVLAREDLPANAARIGTVLKAGIEHLADEHELIGAVHGRGLYLGVDLVRDRATREPAVGEALAVCERMRELGVIIQPTGDHANVLKLKPPLCIDRPAAELIVDALDRALRELKWPR
jgi:4-aminobutyrate aminotransferase-like enzyme/Ser/Thr protein kinase RdoA (MazF antagonist)